MFYKTDLFYSFIILNQSMSYFVKYVHQTRIKVGHFMAINWSYGNWWISILKRSFSFVHHAVVKVSILTLAYKSTCTLQFIVVLWFQVFLSNTNNLHTTIRFQVFQSNTNNLHTDIWFQVFLSNKNDLHIILWFQVFLSNKNDLHTILWFQVLLSNINNYMVSSNSFNLINHLFGQL